MSTHDLDIRPVAGRIGAEVAGVTLSADLPDATVAAIDAIALIESGLAELCTVTIGVTAPREVRMLRATA